MKSYFLQTRLETSVGIDGKIRTLLTPLSYYSVLLDEVITVPIGFETDFGSIPQMFQNILPKDGTSLFAYIIHDLLYQITYRNDRLLCDSVLKEAQECLGESFYARNTVKLGLRIGGAKAWNEHKNKGLRNA